MGRIGKPAVFAALVIGVIWIHRDRRKRSGLGWAAYGKTCLGIGTNGKGRQAYLDELRCLAALLVILVHGLQSAAAGFPQDSSWYRFAMGAAGLGLCCNLLFVMISGALLLPYRGEGISAFYRKRAAKVVIPLGAYYLFYLHRSGLVSFSCLSILQACKTMLAGPMELVPHFWLVYVFVRLYIGVPFYRWMVKDMPDGAVKALLAVFLSGAGLKTACYLLGTGFGFDTVWFSWEGIFFSGYALTRLNDKKTERLIWGFGLIAACLVPRIHCMRADAAAIASNDSILMILLSIAVFQVFLHRERKRKKGGFTRQGKGTSLAVRIISRYSYSVLLIHWFMLFVVAENHLHIGPQMFGGKWMLAAVLLQSLVALVLSLIFAVLYDNTAVLFLEWIWGKIPWGKRTARY